MAAAAQDILMSLPQHTVCGTYFFLLPKTIFFSKYFPYNPTLGRSTRDLSENTNIIAEKCHYRRRHSLKVLRGKNV